MGIKSYLARRKASRQAKRRAKAEGGSSYTIDLSPTPAGQTKTTGGVTISTPGTKATTGYSSGGGGGGSSGGGTSLAEYSARSGLTTTQTLQRMEEQKKQQL